MQVYLLTYTAPLDKELDLFRESLILESGVSTRLVSFAVSTAWPFLLFLPLFGSK